MPLHPIVARVTDRIRARSEGPRATYLERMAQAVSSGPVRAHLSCGNQAHAYAAMGPDKAALVLAKAPHLGIVTSYNDMLSAHQPFERFPDLIRKAATKAGVTVQVAGGVPAMCDGVTQGQPGMELSLFSRDVIALAAGVAMSHNCFDAALYLGVCDKIVPGLIMAAATFGHVPAGFVPAGPMTSGIPNDEKSRVRNAYAEGRASREELMAAEMASYHGPGTCTFYGTANTNQMLMELMGFHLPGSAFVHPNTPLREALVKEAARRAAAVTAKGAEYIPVGRMIDEKSVVNGVVGLMATGGSTNLALHLVAMAHAAGVILTLEDLDEISKATPLLARVYPNGSADVNHFQAAGGMAFVIRELLKAGLAHEDVLTIAGPGLSRYTQEPILVDGELSWRDGAAESLDTAIVRPVSDAFSPEGGLRMLGGNIGRGVMKISAVKPEHHAITAPAAVFQEQEDFIAAFKRGELDRDVVVVMRFQGPAANGMPELHNLSPSISVLLDRGFKVALVTDGRMSGASGKVPAAIHVSPECLAGGPLLKVQDGDMILLDAEAGVLEVKVDAATLAARPAPQPDLAAGQWGMGRELFAAARMSVSDAEQGAASFGWDATAACATNEQP